jgi:hypothetical protein
MNLHPIFHDVLVEIEGNGHWVDLFENHFMGVILFWDLMCITNFLGQKTYIKITLK